MESFKDYQSRIDYLRSISDFHFDPFLREPPPFAILGHFMGADWMSEVKSMEAEANGGLNFGFASCVDCASHKDRKNVQFDLKLTGDTSYTTDHIFLNRLMAPLLTPERAPNIFKIVDWFEFEPTSVDPRIHIQRPGQVFPLHIDGLIKHHEGDHGLRMKAKPGQHWCRVQVQLEDWIWGHVWTMGNSYWSQWKAGEIMYFNWREVPHSTANCGYASRYSMQITGLTTKNSIEKLKLRAQQINIS